MFYANNNAFQSKRNQPLNVDDEINDDSTDREDEPLLRRKLSYWQIIRQVTPPLSFFFSLKVYSFYV